MNHDHETRVLQEGDPVRVSDGTPEPPPRHTRKRARWELHNFTGAVHRIERDGGIAVRKSLALAVVIDPRTHTIERIEG